MSLSALLVTAWIWPSHVVVYVFTVYVLQEPHFEVVFLPCILGFCPVFNWISTISKIIIIIKETNMVCKINFIFFFNYDDKRLFVSNNTEMMVVVMTWLNCLTLYPEPSLKEEVKNELFTLSNPKKNHSLWTVYITIISIEHTD